MVKGDEGSDKGKEGGNQAVGGKKEKCFAAQTDRTAGQSFQKRKNQSCSSDT